MNQFSSMDRFKKNAELVSAVIYKASSLEEALTEVIRLCLKKPVRQSQLQDKASAKKDDISISKKIVAAPNLPNQAFERLKDLCDPKEIRLIQTGVRSFPGGIDVGLTMVDYGIAETGTLVLNSDSEETRLATMLSEWHVALLPKSKIRETALDMTQELTALTRHPSSYTAFITGASRTADIERVLALGVHGPLELHIILLEEE